MSIVFAFQMHSLRLSASLFLGLRFKHDVFDRPLCFKCLFLIIVRIFRCFCLKKSKYFLSVAFCMLLDAEAFFGQIICFCIDNGTILIPVLIICPLLVRNVKQCVKTKKS